MEQSCRNQDSVIMVKLIYSWVLMVRGCCPKESGRDLRPVSVTRAGAEED